MMRRFQRKRRGGSESRPGPIDAGEWLTRIADQNVVETNGLEVFAAEGVPDSVAAIGRGERPDATPVLVAFSPHSATEALLAGLAAAAQAGAESAFSGELVIVSPQWPAGARRVLGLVGRTPHATLPIAAPGLADGRVVVEPEPTGSILAADASQLAARTVRPETRAAFVRAAAALEGLAAKHGGCVRVGTDRLELVVLARRVAEIRVDGESAVLEVQVGGRSTTPLSGADLAGALDGLEGQLRRRLNDRKVRDGEEGLRGRVIAQLAAGGELRGLRPWPQPGTDQAAIDGVGVNQEGDPVVIAVREEMDWPSLAAVLESLGPISNLIPILFAGLAPPLRLETPRLLLAAERFEGALEGALAALVPAFELRSVAGEAGAGLDLVARAAGEGAEARPSRRGRRRGGRGRSAGDGRREESDGSAETEAAESEPRDRDRPLGPRADERDEEDAGRGRGRRRRRPRRGGRGGGSDGSAAEEAARDQTEAEAGPSGDRGRGRRGRFEEVSLMDLDDGPAAGGTGPAAEVRSEARDDDTGGNGTDRRRRGRRRGRRSGARASDDGEGEEEDGESDPVGVDVSTPKEAADDDDANELQTEVDLVDADDLSEILARLPDDVSDFDAAEVSFEGDEDDEGEAEEDGASARRTGRGAGRSGRANAPEGDDETRPAPRKRSAILVHADPDSLFSAILLARDIRQLEGLWIYPQAELMTFFRSIATDLREDTPIFLVGFSPSPAHDVIQASALYRGRLTWFDRAEWPPEDRFALGDSIGTDAIHGGDGIDSSLPLVLETCSRRSRFSDKLVDLATGRFSQHDFERWGRLWRWRIGEIAAKSGDIRSDVAPLLAGRPSDLAKDAALVDVPPPPAEVAWVAERDFRLVHFGGHVMVVLEVDPEVDLHLCSRVARERYGATLSLARTRDAETFVFAGDETTGKRALDYLAIAEHLVEKLEWVEARGDADHVSRFRIRDLARHPERLEEVVSEIAMGRSLLER